MTDKDQKLIYENMYGRTELLNEPEDALQSHDEPQIEREWMHKDAHDPAELHAIVKHVISDEPYVGHVRDLLEWIKPQLDALAGAADVGDDEGGYSTAMWYLIDDLQEELIDLVEDIGVASGQRPPEDWGTDQEGEHGNPDAEKMIHSIKLFMKEIDKLRPQEGDA